MSSERWWPKEPREAHFGNRTIGEFETTDGGTWIQGFVWNDNPPPVAHEERYFSSWQEAEEWLLPAGAEEKE